MDELLSGFTSAKKRSMQMVVRIEMEMVGARNCGKNGWPSYNDVYRGRPILSIRLDFID